MVLGIIGWLGALYWTAQGCFALREFTYSRLDDLCETQGRPERFRQVLFRQDQSVIVLHTLRTFCAIFLGVLTGANLGLPWDSESGLAWPSIWVYLIVIVAGILAGVIGPWLISRVWGERFLYWNWPLISLISWVATPLVYLTMHGDHWMHRVTGLESPARDDATSIEHEIRTVVDEGEREGVIESDASEMIHRVMEFQDEDVGAIMTPRTQMICIQVDRSIDEARNELIDSGHSRVPVIGDSTDDVIGILYSKDMLKYPAGAEPGQRIPILRDIIREPFYIPESTAISKLLELMKRKHVQIAIVLDEYGGIAGLVTMEDILEEIVGEIADEYDIDEIREKFNRIDENTVEIDARMHLDDFNEEFKSHLPEDDAYDTMAGFVFSQFGRLPSQGESVAWEALVFRVLETDRRAITRLRVERNVALPASDSLSGNSQ